MKQFSPRILSNRSICSGFHEMTFSWDPSVPAPRPGQFFTLRITEDTVPLLRRPFAFSAFDPAALTASMIYQKRGRGTELLAAGIPDDRLDLLGPLGNPFPLPAADRRTILVAGGIGLGPIAFLASVIGSRGAPGLLIFGCRTAALLPDTASFRDLAPVICTDDGSAGIKGTTADYLASQAPSITPAATLYACGPMPMLAACHRIALERDCACFVSIEQVMACGVGACMGCAVKMAGGGFKRACVEGPVFESRELQW